MTDAPAIHSFPVPRTTAEVLDVLADVGDGLRAVRKAVERPDIRYAISELIDRVNACRTAIPDLSTVQKKKMRRSISTRASEHPIWQAKNRVTADGVHERFCPRHDNGTGAWLPAVAFDTKDPVKGTLRYCCRDCWRCYQRERYVAANKRAIIIEVRQGDQIVGATCNACSGSIDIGDLVVGALPRHQECATESGGPVLELVT